MNHYERSRLAFLVMLVTWLSGFIVAHILFFIGKFAEIPSLVNLGGFIPFAGIFIGLILLLLLYPKGSE